LCTCRNGPGRRQTLGDFTGKYSRTDRVPITTALASPQIKETVKWLKAEARKGPFCHTLIDTTEFDVELMRLKIVLLKCFRTFSGV
jgi:hypothetical protein